MLLAERFDDVLDGRVSIARGCCAPRTLLRFCPKPLPVDLIAVDVLGLKRVNCLVEISAGAVRRRLTECGRGNC